ncbi:MAG: hypothetical protein JSS51_09095 [Planctomycetes bacterium]|nr:hypothetical protein [Planctomycetota bacterium]
MLFSAALAMSAPAQRLHFGTDEPKDHPVATRMLADLEAQDESLRALAQPSVRQRAKLAYSDAAAALIKLGVDKGSAGTPWIIAGAALVAGKQDVCEALDRGALPEPSCELLRRSLESLASNPPENQAELDRTLRAAFAELLQATGKVSDWPWPESPEAPAPLWPDFSRAAGALAPEASAALQTLHERCELASSWVGYAPGSRSMTRLVMDASWPLGREKQMSAGLYRRWMGELGQAAASVVGSDAGGEPATGASGLERLRRLALLGRLCGLLDALAPDPAAKQLEKLLLAAAETMPEDPAINAGWVRLEPWLELAASRTALADEKTVVRQLRPAVRSIGELARSAQSEMLESLGKVATKPDAAGDPGVLASVTLCSDTLALLGGLHRASDAVEDSDAPRGDPVARESAKAITDSLLRLSKEVADPKQRDRSLAAIRALSQDVAELLELPGEKRLRDGDKALETLIGVKPAELVAFIDRERAAWRKEVGGRNGTAAGAEPHAQKLRAVSALLALALDAESCRSGASPSGVLAAWGGWPLAPETTTTLAVNAATAVPDALAKAMNEQSPLAGANETAAEHAVASLAGKLARRLGDSGNPRPQQPPMFLVRAIATGSPDVRAVLLAKWREPVALVCRYAADGTTGDSEAKSFANRKAAELLRGWKQSEEPGK